MESPPPFNFVFTHFPAFQSSKWAPRDIFRRFLDFPLVFTIIFALSNSYPTDHNYQEHGLPPRHMKPDDQIFSNYCSSSTRGWSNTLWGSAIHPLLCAWVHRCLWSASIIVIDTRLRVYHPSLHRPILLFWVLVASIFNTICIFILCIFILRLHCCAWLTRQAVRQHHT